MFPYFLTVSVLLISPVYIQTFSILCFDKLLWLLRIPNKKASESIFLPMPWGFVLSVQA